MARGHLSRLDHAVRQAAPHGRVYDDAESEARRIREQALARAGVGSEAALAATDDLVHALVVNGKGHASEARALAQDVLQQREAVRGARDPGLASSLINLGDVLSAAGAFAAAVELFERALVVLEPAQPLRPPPGLARALDGMGATLASVGRHPDALASMERSLRLKREGDADPVDVLRTLELLARTRQSTADYAQSARLLADARGVLETVPLEHPVRVDFLNRAAQQLWFEGRLRESLATSEQAVALADRTLRPGHPSAARALRYLGGTLADLGDLPRSRDVRARALARVESEFGSDHVETGLYLNSVSMADLDLGAFPAARRGFERVRAIMEAGLGPSHDFVATAYLNLALVDARLGDHAAAQREHGRATGIWERTLGRDHPFVALGLSELAAAYQEQGEPARALPLLQRAYAIRQRALGAEHRDVAATAGDLAVVLSALGQVTRARGLADRAVQVLERQGMAETPEFADVLVIQGELQMRVGDARGAVQSYRTASSIRERAFGSDHPVTADAHAGLAASLAASGAVADAVSLAATAETASREHLRLLLAELPERQSLNYAATRPRTLDLILSMWDRDPNAATLGLDQLVRSRALVLDEVAARRVARPGDHETAARFEELSTARRRLANLLVRGPRPGAEAQHAALVDEARTESESAEQRLAERSAAFRTGTRRAMAGIDDVRRALPDDAALVSFVRYRRTVVSQASTRPSRAGAIARPRFTDSYLAFVLRSDGVPTPVRLGTVATIDAAVADWRRAMVPSGTTDPQASENDQGRAAGAVLRRLVWDPVATQLDGARRVFIVTDGALGLVPFAAFPIGRRSFLLETGPTLHYLSAERDLASPPADPPSSTGILAVGGASFDQRARSTDSGPPLAGRSSPPLLRGGPPCADLRTIVFQPLAGTLREVRDISAQWTAAAATASEMGSARVLAGPAASEREVKASAARHRVLHVATHGFFLNPECVAAAAGTRGVGGLAPARPRAPANPLLLSGLALAGANRRAQARPDEDDGILTAEEVAALDLSGVEWAVLSACDTGVGEIKAGEGVFGLRRAFQVAGARTVIMSLWSVEDQATRAWMRALYEGRFLKKLSTADAVHQASLSVLRDRRARGLSTHPFFWAAFVAAGDWR